jgi:hypothetical protein
MVIRNLKYVGEYRARYQVTNIARSVRKFARHKRMHIRYDFRIAGKFQYPVTV